MSDDFEIEIQLGRLDDRGGPPDDDALQKPKPPEKMIQVEKMMNNSSGRKAGYLRHW